MTTSPFLQELAFHVPSKRLSANTSARIMFYLPVVTPWWFEYIVVHLIRVMARAHETHVLIPPLWHNTGLGEGQLHLIQDLDHVQWHLLDGPDHPLLRGTRVRKRISSNLSRPSRRILSYAVAPTSKLQRAFPALCATSWKALRPRSSPHQTGPSSHRHCSIMA